MGVATALLVRYQGGYFTVTDAAGMDAWGRKVGFLQLGSIVERSEAERIAAAVLGFQSQPRVATTIGIEPTGAGDEPYADYSVGDEINAPESDGSNASQRVVSLTVAEDENGDVSFANELKAIFLVREETFDRQLKKLLNGTMRGSSVSPNQIPTGSITRAENGDSVGGLRQYTNGQLLRRPSFVSSDTIFGGAFDSSTDQAIEIDYPVTLTSGVGGFSNVPIIVGVFPTGLISAQVQMGDAPGGLAYHVSVINSSSDNTEIAVLIVDAGGAGYPDTSALTVNVHAVGW